MNIRESKTEKFLIASMSVLAFILVASFFVKEPVGVRVASADNHESEQSEKSEEDGSEKSEQSEDDESEASEDDESEYSEEYSESSEYSEYSADTGTTPNSVAPSGVAVPAATQGNAGEESVEMSEDESSEMSEEMSEEMEDEASEISEVEGYDEVVSVEGNTAEVRKKERLFGIFQIETESQVTLNEAGEVIDERRGLWNWLLSTLSF